MENSSNFNKTEDISYCPSLQHLLYQRLTLKNLQFSNQNLKKLNQFQFLRMNLILGNPRRTKIESALFVILIWGNENGTIFLNIKKMICIKSTNLNVFSAIKLIENLKS